MNDAAAILIGEHDFAAFQASGSDVVTTDRELTVSRMIEPDSAESEAEPNRLRPFGVPSLAPGRLVGYEVTGGGFLRHMVRNIVGTLVDIGRYRRPVDEMDAVLASRNRANASATAPPQGLVLWGVDY
jgi:tRNA pseudouridine38-40 synthase